MTNQANSFYPGQNSGLNNNFRKPPNNVITPSVPPMPLPNQMPSNLRQPQFTPPMPPMPPQQQYAQQQNYDQGSFGSPQRMQPTNQYLPNQSLPNRPYPTSAQPGYVNGQGSRQPQFSQNMSADNFPSAVEVMESNRTQFTGVYYTAQRGVIPPLVTTDCPTRDQGICAPYFIRSSYYAVPCSSELLKTVGLPFSLTISPFAEKYPEDMEILISDMGAQGPVRCARCKAYMNPFMNFIDGGRRFQCVLCNGMTEVGADYFSHLDYTGRRVDTSHRPELCLGSYELLATPEYCKNNQFPQAPALIFLLDVSLTSLRSGMVKLFCMQFMNRIFPKLPKESPDSPSPVRIGFITYDHQIHFYNLTHINDPDSSETLTNGGGPVRFGRPQMHIVSDIEDVFVPAVEGFLIPPDPNAISCILEMIMTQFCADVAAGPDGFQPRNTPTDALLGPAIQAGLEALRSANRAGKLFVMHSNLPSGEGPGKLKAREVNSAIGTEKEKTLLNPSCDFYTGLGNLCVEAGCSVDLFLFASSYIDIATLAEVPKLTAGHLYKYNCFQGVQFLSDLEFALTSLKAFNAVMRVRTSTGIRPVDFFGNFYQPNTSDIELATVSSDTAITVDLRHDEKLQESDLIFIQAACLYTSVSGQRRLRIHNLSLSVTTSIAEVFRLSELDTHMNWMTKYAVRSLLHRTNAQVLEDLSAKTAATLAAYRRHCTNGPGDVASSSGELVLPQNMKLYPLYVQCLLKTEAFASADGISIDDRCWQMFLVSRMNVKQSNIYLYPRVYPLMDLSTNFEGDIAFPPAMIRCSYDRLQHENAYFIENGLYLILWIGSRISPKWIDELFNPPDPNHFATENIYDLQHFDNDTSRNLCTLLRKIRQGRLHYSRLLVIRPGDKNEIWFRRLMMEDRGSSNSLSYTDYLCHIHKEVTAILRH